MFNSKATVLVQIFLCLLLSILSTDLFATTQNLNILNLKTVPEKSGPNLLVIPFELVGKMIVVKGSVNGHQGNLIVDTGADIMVLHARIFPQHQYILPVDGANINNRFENLRMINVKFNWMGIQRKNLAAKIIDLSLVEHSKGIEILGFIGHSVLKHYEVLFDYQEQLLMLFRLDRKGERINQTYFLTPPVYKIKLSMVDHFPYLTMKEGKMTFRLIIDSGAEMNILSPRAEEILVDYLAYVNTRQLIGFGKETILCKAYLHRNFKVSDLKLKPMHTLIREMDGFNDVLDHALDGFLGYEFLSQQKVSINLKRKELLVWTR